MPTAFISYAHENDGHQSKALSLSNRLREGGVDASIDAYTLHPAEGWAKWMEKQLRLEFLILILSPRYIKEFNQEHVTSSGARFETSMISSILLSRGVSFERIAIVLFDTWGNLVVPEVLYSCQRYYVDRVGEYEKLYAFVTGQELVTKPALGKFIKLPARSPPERVPHERSFAALCKLIWPLVDENGRIFRDFGPNSGAALSGEKARSVRFDLSLWRIRREQIGQNNDMIAAYLREYADVVPGIHSDVFSRWLSHIDAFRIHLQNELVDYREHQFPAEVVGIIKGSL